MSDFKENMKEQIRDKAFRWGADLVGFASVNKFESESASHHPYRILVNAQTVIVLGIAIVDPILDLWVAPREWRKPSYQSYSSRAFSNEILAGIGHKISRMIMKKGYSTVVAPYSPGLYLKVAGVHAGLGFIGRNNLLVTHGFGPNVRLRAVVTELVIESDPSQSQNLCGSCFKCVEACPVGALEKNRYSREKCESFVMNEESWSKISESGRVTCEICIRICPYSQK